MVTAQTPVYMPLSGCGALDMSNDPAVEEAALEKLADGFAECLCGKDICACPPMREYNSSIYASNNSPDLLAWTLANEKAFDRMSRDLTKNLFPSAEERLMDAYNVLRAKWLTPHPVN